MFVENENNKQKVETRYSSRNLNQVLVRASLCCIKTKDYQIENKHDETNKRAAVSVFSTRITLKLEEAVII
jgi:hypothetical protein